MLQGEREVAVITSIVSFGSSFDPYVGEHLALQESTKQREGIKTKQARVSRTDRSSETAMTGAAEIKVRDPVVRF